MAKTYLQTIFLLAMAGILTFKYYFFHVKQRGIQDKPVQQNEFLNQIK